MKGYLLYDAHEVKRNEAFIEDLQKEAKAKKIDLTLVTDVDEIPNDTAFVFSRSRDAYATKSLEDRHIRVFNRSEVTKIANNKLDTMNFAALLGVPTVPTEKITNIGKIRYPYPIIVKTTDGHSGEEVHLCQTPQMVYETMQNRPDATWIAQPFIQSNKQDVRVFTLGHDIIGAIRRTGTRHAFKSNYTLGGTIDFYPIDDELRQYVEKIVTALKSDYIGIDFLLPADGRYVLNEIEDPVGARSMYAHDVPVASLLIDYFIAQLSQS